MFAVFCLSETSRWVHYRLPPLERELYKGMIGIIGGQLQGLLNTVRGWAALSLAFLLDPGMCWPVDGGGRW